MEKAIEIKRRAQRCIQNGDLDGALGEYEKLVAADDSDPYNFVLLADLLYKKGDHGGAARRYLSAADAYQKNTLHKNAIAVCKKMMRLSLSPALVLQRLATLHGLDGLTTEAVLYYQQHADLMLRGDKADDAAASLKSAFEISPENLKTLERLADVHMVRADRDAAAATLADAIERYEAAGDGVGAERCRKRLNQIKPGGFTRPKAVSGLAATPAAGPAIAMPMEAFAAPVEPPAATAYADPSALHLEGPGLRFEPPLAPPEPAPVPDLPFAEQLSSGTSGSATAEPSAPPSAADRDGNAAPVAGSAKIEKLLAFAQEQFKSGHRDVATSSLIEAARSYEEQGELDNAATIYRSLSRSASTAREVMILWLKNCEARRDLVEAAQVACELGDLSLNENDRPVALSWFRRARVLDSTNALAYRRIERLKAEGVAEGAQIEAAVGATASAAAGVRHAPAAYAPPYAAELTQAPAASAAVPAAPPPAPATPADAPDPFVRGRVEVEVGRGGAVTFDLGSLVSEFQRGIEAQISGDAQGHYDLAMTYREMGLLEQAIEAFRCAAVDPVFVVRCTEMIGRSLLDEGRFDDAAREFEAGLSLPGLTPMARADLRYQLGLAHEAAGRAQEALAEFERVYAMHASYPDVALKIRVLRKTLESL